MTITSASSRDKKVFIDKFDPEAFRALARTAQAAGAAAARAGLPVTLVELVNLRVSQINGCAYCLRAHTRAALEAGENPQRLGLLAAWRETDVFTPSERAALALAEATTSLNGSARAGRPSRHATLSQTSRSRPYSGSPSASTRSTACRS
ncbi:alkylhydroperoxidase AhpD family core domain-containing protein [Streptomyces sp. Cmuel-A718b]|nr:alkylhydroperoxidase AhpD family core domain-containing protein [Streptomyces sp. Cmuel-A718b]